MRMKKCSMSCTCNAKRRSRPQNVLKVARLPHRIDIAQKTRTKKRAKRALRKRDLRGHHFVREFRRKQKMKELLCSKMAHTYDTTSNEHRALTPTVRKMIFQHHQSTGPGHCTARTRPVFNSRPLVVKRLDRWN